MSWKRLISLLQLTVNLGLIVKGDTAFPYDDCCSSLLTSDSCAKNMTHFDQAYKTGAIISSTAFFL